MQRDRFKVAESFLRVADGDYRTKVADLQEAIEEDLEAGNLPMAVATSAGMVNTGAVDPSPLTP